MQLKLSPLKPNEKYGEFIITMNYSTIYQCNILRLHRSILGRRSTYRGAAGSPLTLLTLTLALGHWTLQTQEKKGSGGTFQGHKSGNVHKDRILESYPFICQRRLWSNNTRTSTCRQTYCIWFIYSQPAPVYEWKLLKKCPKSELNRQFCSRSFYYQIFTTCVNSGFEMVIEK